MVELHRITHIESTILYGHLEDHKQHEEHMNENKWITRSKKYTKQGVEIKYIRDIEERL